MVDGLQHDLIRLGDTVDQGVMLAVNGLFTHNSALAHWPLEQYEQIKRDRHHIEERVLWLFGTQQPIVARDLRLLWVINPIAVELEHIADDISRIAHCVLQAPLYQAAVQPPALLHDMGVLAQHMLHCSMEAFVHDNADAGSELLASYERVQQMADELRTELTNRVYQDATTFAAVSDLLDVVQALQRTAERALIIAERVIYLVTCSTDRLRP
jgi:phosphate transport system protein